MLELLLWTIKNVYIIECVYLKDTIKKHLRVVEYWFHRFKKSCGENRNENRNAGVSFESSRVSKKKSRCFKEGVSLLHFVSASVTVWEFRCFSFRGRLFHFSRTAVSVCKNGCFTLQERLFQFSRTGVSLCKNRCYNFNDENKAVTLQDGQQ